VSPKPVRATKRATRRPDPRRPAGSDPIDLRHLREALALAAPMVGLTTPNPAVGCIIVRRGRIVGRGGTARGGRPHAETQALAQAGARARGATAYVSLEPCAHRGQTPPCARKLVEAGIARVVVGCVDPYPPVRGRGIAILRRAGIEVAVGVLEEECRRLNEGFFTRQTQRRPFGLLKLAMSLDGRIAALSGDSRWISSQESRALVHQWRRECDAVIVGAGTVAADNPRLTCRIPEGRDPVRVIVDSTLRTSARALVLSERSSAPAIVVTSAEKAAAAERRFAGANVEVLAIPTDEAGIDLTAMMRAMGRRGWCKVMFEGGAHLAASALRAGLIDRVAFFLAPKIVGAGLSAVEGIGTNLMRHAIRLADMTVTRIGVDLLIEGRPERRRSRRLAPNAR
jgi:diaminohydroxyphosphoribosylaminopyrimidine deaminase/5-amino-6-(5-phosphoribosylamino)uracil reductase